MGEKPPENLLSDSRLEFLATVVHKSLRLKADRWAKLIVVDEARRTIQEFLDQESIPLLIISQTGPGVLSVSSAPISPSNPLTGPGASSSRLKSVYFLKKRAEAVSRIDPRSSLLFGDISPQPLEQVMSFLDDVVVPTIESSVTEQGYPSLIVQDLQREARALRGAVARVRGTLEGRTVLPVPWRGPLEKEEHPPLTSRSAAFLSRTDLEQAVQGWSQQLAPILADDTKALPRNSPQEEISYWKNRAQDLEGIFGQMKKENVRKMAANLEQAKSTYADTFRGLLKQVVTALAESQDIALHLKPLARPLETIESTEISELHAPLKAMFHSIALVWVSCTHYRKPARFLNLLQQLANLLIDKARTFLDPRSLFSGEPEESMERISTVLEATTLYKSLYKEQRSLIAPLFKRFNDKVEAQEWQFSSRLIFGRLEFFIKRLQVIKNMFVTFQEYGRLSRVELSTGSGRNLSLQLTNICAQFSELRAPFLSGISGDCLEPENEVFDSAVKAFERGINALEKKLCAVLGHALDDCTHPQAAGKVVSLLGTFMEHPLLQTRLRHSFPHLADMALQEIKVCQDLYLKLASQASRSDSTRPPTAAAVFNLRELDKRAWGPVKALQNLSITSQTPQAHQAFERYEQLTEQLKRLEEIVVCNWAKNLGPVLSSLTQPLLVRNGHFVTANVHPHFAVALWEARSLLQLEVKIPREAQEMAAKHAHYQALLNSVDLIVTSYRNIKSMTSYQLNALLRPRLETLEDLVELALVERTWDTPALTLDPFLQQLEQIVLAVESTLNELFRLLESIKSVTSLWCKAPLLDRMDVAIENHDLVLKRYGEIAAGGKKIESVIGKIRVLLEIEHANEAWTAFVEVVEKIVLEGLLRSVGISFSYLLDHTHPRYCSSSAMVEVSLEFQKCGPVFNPSLNDDDPKGLKQLFEQNINHILNVAGQVQRLSRPNNYQAEVAENHDVLDMRNKLWDRLNKSLNHARGFRREFDKYSHLWTSDMHDFLLRFVQTACPLAPMVEDSKTRLTSVPESEFSPPTLENYQEQLQYLQKLQIELFVHENYRLVDNWLKVHVQPAMQGLEELIESWKQLFIQHLTEHVTESLEELEQFIQDAEEGLLRPVAPDGQGGAALLTVMAHLADVKNRQVSIDALFPELGQAAQLLRVYDHELSEELLLNLNELPGRWKGLKQAAQAARQQVASLQANEIATLRRAIIAFDSKQLQFREEFHKLRFFWYDCADAYIQLDDSSKKLGVLETEMRNLVASAALFEVNVTEFKPLKNCRKETTMLKHLWDYIFIVRTSVEHWKTTPWKDIDVERMEIECKHFAKNIRGLDKEMRNWDAFTGLEGAVKNLLTSLKAVAELQNTAVKERHWAQLIEATKRKPYLRENFTVNFVTDQDTTLADLLALHLHRYEEEVRAVVDRAVREVSMERVLRELEATWASLELGRESHPRTGLTLLKANDELIATLEDNQVQLQTLATSKYVAHLMGEVLAWQKKLALADSVICQWCEVQRSWSHLESIFVGSEDIRKQLPADSQRFDDTNQAFQDLLSQLLSQPNVIAVATKPGLLVQLEFLQDQLTLCEKALAEYLECKRTAFPRFYFVATADLLDILSNGNQCTLVQKHLTKLFDSVAKLKIENKTGCKEGIQEALGMFAKDGEYVNFDTPLECTGMVEVWLNSLVRTMRSTLRYWLQEAVATYEEKPRDQWLLEYPAQVALTASQIWWAAEVQVAFQRLEEGYENAMKDLYRKQVAQLHALINQLLGDLTAQERQKIMTLCTIDVHARDVVAKLIQQKVESSSAFAWQAQLRHRWNEVQKDCCVDICDAQFRYWYEYLGNTPRLVITPLTDRCYITLTQSLHLTMGGAPSGPAGTGKTETSKDLGRALGMMVYVFNCSEQMDYKSCGNIYKGLAQTGAWGCFDEFNRITVEVLSVVAVQVKSILDSVRLRKEKFNFMGEEIALQPSVGLFVTMNPGYAGRTELPENVKALFRPCAMIVPDFDLICEIMLVAEGFLEAKALARKFVTLYSLCRQLLSQQDHYDWGLRAIKSVLVVAGSSKRSNHTWTEEQVLMGALRDANLPKLVTDDVPVFLSLVGDLFPSVDSPRLGDAAMDRIVRQAALDLKLQPEDVFVTRVLQLHELLQVRHSVFMLGKAGTGKTQVWKTLLKAYSLLRLRPVCIDLDPKAVTSDELFGFVNPTTREWRDGLFSSIIRDQAALTNNSPKWIVLDGDIDPLWIESLNTLMDDNKVLTLASNERVSLTPHMRLIFEISHLKSATPSTVSRAGILHLNQQDLGWTPYVTSWIETRMNSSERAHLSILMDKYVPSCLEVLRSRFKPVIPLPEICHLQMLCKLLDCLLVPEHLPADSPRELYEQYYVFACIWAFGSALNPEQTCNQRFEFSQWWLSEFKSIRFPAGGSVFDFCIDPEIREFIPWSDRVPKFEPDPELPIHMTIVPTVQTTCLRYFMDLLLAAHQPLLVVGPAGCGKTALVEELLASLPEDFTSSVIPFHYYMTSEMVQAILEKPLEKKAGKTYAPPANKRLVVFIDDINAPMVDFYGTVQAHTLLRQQLSYGHWYDRFRLTQKEIRNVQYIACMNPASGSFTLDSRLQRHFLTFAVSNPTTEAIHQIYGTWLQKHLSNPLQKFPPSLPNLVPGLVAASMTLHTKLCQVFQPTSVKFHYGYNMRDLAAVFKGLLFSNSETLITALDLVRLWVHEFQRVYGDRLADDKDLELFRKILSDTVKKCFDRQGGSEVESCSGFFDVDEVAVLKQPLIFCHFSRGLGDSKYCPAEDWSIIQPVLHQALASYNDLNPAMDLVLFEDAMAHVCRINRILESSRGNALLIGVGGSGKQSLARLAASISGFDVCQLSTRKGYGVSDLKTDLSALCLKAGMKKLPIVLLITDAHLTDEQILGPINDFLAAGEVSGLFADDEVENIVSGVRNEVKALGLVDSWDTCWRFFLDQVRRHLHIVLCCSPVGPTLRLRCQRFPALLASMTLDWFLPWPPEALLSVSLRFLLNMPILAEHFAAGASQFMAHVHSSVNDASRTFLQVEGRYSYTTPKSFLEQLQLYQRLLNQQHSDLRGKVERLENGLEKLRNASIQVDELKERLAVQEVELKQKKEDADRLIQVVRVETEKVTREKGLADIEEEKVAAIALQVSQKQKECEEDLIRAEPALAAAQEALNTLNKANLTELKSFGTPPSAVTNVAAAVLVLLAPNGKVAKDRSWRAGKVMMARVDQFLDALINYDKEHIHPEVIKAIQPYMDNPEFDPELVRSKSVAAAGLCSWVINIIKFYDVYCDVEPKRRALEQANAELAAAQDKVAAVRAKVASLEATLQQLTADFQQAMEEKKQSQAQAEATHRTLEQAHRLLSGLASEKVRWAQAVENLKKNENTLPGDVLLATAFISYAGCFSKQCRQDLMQKTWLPFLRAQAGATPILLAPDADPVALLADSAQVAEWNNEGLPADRMSVENAAILTTCDRWPLIIDPQLQGIKWVKGHYSSQLQVTQLGQKGFLESLERCLREGLPLLIEDLGEDIDNVLDPLLGRLFIKKGRAIKMNDKEMEYNSDFRLILHTKLPNPHYRPELQAQTTLINFTVTRAGLEEQLLAEVVRMERPDLEQRRAELIKQENDFKISLKKLEDDLLLRLSKAEGQFLADACLVDSLENTKRTSTDIAARALEASNAAVLINEIRELYRPAASRASLLYFVISELHQLNPIYQFSLKAFVGVFQKAIERAAPCHEVSTRVNHLIEEITYSIFSYTSRGLFEQDKLVFTAQMAFQILLAAGEIDAMELDFLLRFPVSSSVSSQVDFLSPASWGAIKGLAALDDFKHLDRDIETSSKRWKKIVDSECPEKEKLPQEWKSRSTLQRLCILRALRPDRMTYAIRLFMEEKLGSKYVESRPIDMAKCFQETSPITPLCFILSPGVNPLQEIELLGSKLGRTIENGRIQSVSLGQGQEAVAERALEEAAIQGHWVILQNIHLVKKWLHTLERVLDRLGETAHADYRVFISVEPPSAKESHVIPQGLLESCIKLTSEPPRGIQANLHRALDHFDQDALELCSREAEFKTLLFALCYFHAVVAERRQFGPQGWNRPYPFSSGDLTISVSVLHNYVEAGGGRVPWEDLRYLLGEIMYGGHITDDWDRRLCRAYLEELLHPDLLDGELMLAPNFPAPPNRDYSGYHRYIDEALPPESTHLYGMHPNAEIGILSRASVRVCQALLGLQPRQVHVGPGSGATRDEKVKQMLDDLLERIPEEFGMAEILSRVEERTPYIIVIMQECERLNALLVEIRRSLRELDLGLKGELTLSRDMEELGTSLYMDQVPVRWTKIAYPSTLGLMAWVTDLQQRHKELDTWVSDFQMPPSVWLGGLFSPQAFLTATMQTAARRAELPLDRMALAIEVTKKTREEVTAAPREGAYIHGLCLEGARWDAATGVLTDPKLKELYHPMPVIYVKAVTQDKLDVRHTYECPVYKTPQRGDTFVWAFHLKTRDRSAKWVLAGTALLLQT